MTASTLREESDPVNRSEPLVITALPTLIAAALNNHPNHASQTSGPREDKRQRRIIVVARPDRDSSLNKLLCKILS